MYPKDNPESWRMIQEFINDYPDDEHWSKWKPMARSLVTALETLGLTSLFRIGQGMHHIMLSTSERHGLTSEPRVTLEFQPKEQLVRIAYGHMNLYFSEPLAEVRVAPVIAVPCILGYLRRLWSETKPETQIPDALKTASPAENESRRILPKPEAEALWKRLASTWGIDRHYWWPLSDPRPPHAEGFQDCFFEQEFGYAALRHILAEHGVTTIFEFREDGEAFTVSVATFEPGYSGLEGFWTSDSFDWILYASHEGSITVGGKWLLTAVQATWPTGEKRIWNSPFYEKS